MPQQVRSLQRGSKRLSAGAPTGSQETSDESDIRQGHARQGRSADRGAALFPALCRAHLRGQIRRPCDGRSARRRSEEHTSELQSLMRISYAVFCLKKKTNNTRRQKLTTTTNK